MTIRIGINGFGRIGRCVFRSAQERPNINIVAINDILDINYIAYLLKYDSTHGIFNKNIAISNNSLIINNQVIKCFSEKDPINLKWNEINVDIVIESTGLFLKKEDAKKHIVSGAKNVILTGPSQDEIPMFVIGVNHQSYAGQRIVSNASCTTNCLALIAKIVNDRFGIVEALMTTIHAVTSTQKTVDSPSNKDWRGGRGALQNIIPSSTGAAKAVGKVIPELNKKLTGISFRIPTPNVSVVDLTARLHQSISKLDICTVIREAANNNLKNIIGYTNEHVVSSDFNGNKLTAIFDEQASIVLNERFVKLVAWYDNEFGYSNRVLDLAEHIYNYYKYTL